MEAFVHCYPGARLLGNTPQAKAPAPLCLSTHTAVEERSKHGKISLLETDVEAGLHLKAV